MMEHTDIFFRQYASELKNIDEKAYDLFRQGLITRLLEKPKNMSEKAEADAEKERAKNKAKDKLKSLF